MTMMLIAAAAVEPDRGWGGPVAMLVAILAFAAITRGPGWWRAWRDHHAEDDDAGWDEDEPDDAGMEPPDRPAWWRALAAALWHRDRQPLPSPTQASPTGGVNGADQRIDTTDTGTDTSGDTAWHGVIVTLPDGRRVRAYPDGANRPAAADETREEYAARRLAAGAGYTTVVQEIMTRYLVSEATAKRTVRAARG